MSDIKTNKITIYLLKKGKTIEEVVKENFSSITFNENKKFYYSSSNSYPPKWVNNFFNNELDGITLLNQSSKAVLFSKIVMDNEERIFVITFGYGYSMIEKINCVENFGLKLVLNIVDRNSIRKIEKRTLSSEPKNTIEQLSKIGEISDFGIDIEQDLVEEITGKPKQELEEDFSKSLVTGKMAFTISKKVNIKNIDIFLKTCFEWYRDDSYKDDFSFIDQIKEVKDDSFLNNKLIKKIKGNNVSGIKIWMAIPEIIEWEKISGFSFTEKNENLLNDIDYSDFLKSLTKEQIKNIDIDFLRRKKIVAFKNTDDDEYNYWPVFNCFYCELKERTKTFILTNGKWYEIASSFVNEIESTYKQIIDNSSSTALIPATKNENEKDYNERLANSIPNAILMDRKNIRYGGGSSAIEFCDVYNVDENSFIHVKNYSGSSTLSHLFAQGRVSGQLFLNDKKFREKAKKKENRLPFNPNDKPDPSDYKIIYGIITKNEGNLNLPFFSKVNLKNAIKMLEAFGFKNIYLVKIQKK